MLKRLERAQVFRLFRALIGKRLVSLVELTGKRPRRERTGSGRTHLKRKVHVMTREAILQIDRHNSTPSDDRPLSVKEASRYLGVSPQTVYLWVERKQIPHLRVMGRNIRFLKTDLETFRASFKQEMENA